MTYHRDPHDPMYGHEPTGRTGIWGSLAGVALLVIGAALLVIILILGLAFGVGHGPTGVASNNAMAPQHTTAPAIPPTTPGLAPPPSLAPNRP
jgi:hypothetical protein